MSRKGLEARTTFELTRDVVKTRRKLDELDRGPAWWKPCRYIRRSCIEKFSERHSELLGALINRYQGLFLQIYNGLCHRGANPNRDFGDFVDAWWMHIETPIMGALSAAAIWDLLWEGVDFAANVSFGSESSIALLRPKFLLRPVIDELREPAKRRILLSVAYDSDASSAIEAFSPAEQLQRFDAACEALYGVLSTSGPWTQALKGTVVTALSSTDRNGAVRQLRQWLIGPW